jgi:hypothetical protein
VSKIGALSGRCSRSGAERNGGAVGMVERMDVKVFRQVCRYIPDFA